MSFFNDLQNLDRNNVGGWPQSVKIFFTVLLLGFVLLVGWYFFVSDQQDSLKTLAGKEDQLKQEFSTKQAKSVNLEALQQQLDEMQDMLRQLLRQLPSKTEMPELLTDISQTAQSAGLETDLFQPGAETPKDFYAEKPITLRFTGTYHQFGTFISGVASLPRVVILTLHDVSLTPKSPGKDGPANGQLVLQGTVKTYRYLDDEESSAAGAGISAAVTRRSTPSHPGRYASGRSATVSPPSSPRSSASADSPIPVVRIVLDATTFGAAPSRSRKIGITVSVSSPRISLGTPGSVITQRPCSSSIQSAGAEPKRFSITRAPRGTSACTTLIFGISLPKRRKRLSTCASASASVRSSLPNAAARPTRVRSSAVGPSPPEVITAPVRSSPSRIARAIRSGSSPTVSCRTTATPISERARAMKAALVSIV